MTLVLFILATIGWIFAIVCFLMLVLAAFTISAQEARFREEFDNLKKTYERANVIRSRGKNIN